MTRIYLIILLIITTEFGFTQSVNFDLISCNGLNFYSAKTEIIKTFGQPKTTYDPNYECGFLSTDSQNGKYLTLDYGKVKFTGNDDELYILEQVNMENDNSVKIKYGDNELSCNTDLTKLIEIFGTELENHFENNRNGAIVIFREKAEDGIRIVIKNGKLIRFEYWSPC
jgi:hypothetical protein